MAPGVGLPVRIVVDRVRQSFRSLNGEQIVSRTRIPDRRRATSLYREPVRPRTSPKLTRDDTYDRQTCARRAIVRLTLNGRALLTGAPAAPTTMLLEGLAGLNAGEIDGLAQGLKRICEELALEQGTPETLFADETTHRVRKQRKSARNVLRMSMKVCIVGASGKLGRYMVGHALERGHEVVGVCREQSVGKLAEFGTRITIVPGATNDRAVIYSAVRDCGAVLTVLAPWGVQQYSTGTAQAVLDYAAPNARLVFSCGWHITRDGKDIYPRRLRWTIRVFGPLARLARFADLDDQVEACRRIFASNTLWTVVRGSDLEEGESDGLPVWSRHVGDPVLASNRTRRIDFALFMVAAIENDELIREAPAIVGCRTASALNHAAPPQLSKMR